MIKPADITDSIRRRIGGIRPPRSPILDALNRHPYLSPANNLERFEEAYDAYLQLPTMGDWPGSRQFGIPGIMEWERNECELCVKLLLVGPLNKLLPKQMKVGRLTFELQEIKDIFSPVIPSGMRIVCWRSRRAECNPMPPKAPPPASPKDKPFTEPTCDAEETCKVNPRGMLIIGGGLFYYEPITPENPGGVGFGTMDRDYPYPEYEKFYTSTGNSLLATIIKTDTYEFIGWYYYEWIGFSADFRPFNWNNNIQPNYPGYTRKQFFDKLALDLYNNGNREVKQLKDFYKENFWIEYFGTCFCPWDEEDQQRIDPPQPPPIMNTCNCKQIEKDLRDIKRILGVSQFPITIPRRLIQPRKDGDVQLKSFVDVAEAEFRQTDRAVGWLPMTIEFKGEGESEGLTIQIESLADGIQQLILFAKENSTDEIKEYQKKIADLNIRELYTLAILQKMVVEINYELNQVQEFLGYKQKDIALDTPFAINPLGAVLKDLDKATPDELEKMQEEIFKTTKVKVKVKENVDEKNLQTMLTEILRHANIASAANSFRASSYKAFKDIMAGTEWGMNVAQLLLLREIRTALGGRTKKQFEKWLDETEKRYTADQSPVPGDNAEPFQQEAAARFDVDLTELKKNRLGNE